jgi:hypothetical protein
MKAVTLHNPWAWAVAAGWKEVETRSWLTSYRGPLAIHAGMKQDVDGRMLHLKLNSVRGVGHIAPEWNDLVFGAVVATCNLVACLPTALVEYEAKKLPKWFEPKRGWEVEKLFGNYAPGRWAWILRDVVPIDPPIPAHGWQRLWNWTPPANLSVELGLQP